MPVDQSNGGEPAASRERRKGMGCLEQRRTELCWTLSTQL